MEFVGKRAWKKKVEEEPATSATNKGMRMLPTDIRGAGTSNSSSKKKGKAQTHTHAAALMITLQNISFERLNGINCRKW